ncbi:hypothetical protein GHA01_07600 [Novacetimonas hansenii]|uniref:Uncharacterized protein n=1 Tax=Novacetimonas hansenii TaxID=436 RepID=A0ABQ0SCF5_NOVHA|nr:hypothetical protein Gaha_0093_002 [Novacetimonas hansenii JCM 7643]GEC62911.1 hypothetical protein GHA01_07600 [Novacetimonas hansenii]
MCCRTVMVHGDMFDRAGIQPATGRMFIMMADGIMATCGMMGWAMVGNTMRSDVV